MADNHLDRSRFTVLVADDEADNLSFYQRTLRGYQVLTASRGDEGMSILAERSVDVVVADQVMPGASGSELLARARRVRPLARRVIVSAFAEAEYLLSAINSGNVHRYLVKPVAPETLLTVVDELASEYVGLAEARARLEKMELRLADMRSRPDDPDRRRGPDRRRNERRAADREREEEHTDDLPLTRLRHELARVSRYDRVLSLIVVEEAPGLYELLVEEVRRADAVLRLGRDLLLLLPETDRVGAEVVRERLSAKRPDVLFRLACYPEDGGEVQTLLAAAR